VKRILIATVTAGAGHVQAGVALEEAWRALRPRDVVKRVDVLEYTPAPFRRLYSQGYVQVIQHAPELYARSFRKTDDANFMVKASPLRRKLAGGIARRFIRMVKEFEPHAVLCSHFLPPEVLGSVTQWENRRPFIVSVVTDFEAHAIWMESCVDHTFVAMPETKARLLARGVPDERVSAFGIPVSQRFPLAPNRRQARVLLGFSTGTVVLVLGGGFGMGPVKEILKHLGAVPTPLQIAVVTGRNAVLEQQLKFLPHRHPTRIFGFVDNMNLLMAASNLIITKPGGLTTSEALALGRPLLIVDPIPGQEAANSDFLLEQGAAVKVNRLEDLPHRMSTLLAGNRLVVLSRAARRLGRPNAAKKICQKVLQCLEK
jgi:processive 1,2-diacylglycerol beta-glucosyltransferase